MIRRTARVFATTILAVGLLTLATSSDVVAGSKDDEAKKYTEQLKTTKDTKEKIKAIEKLGALAQINKKLGADALPDIKTALKDKDAGIRNAAAKAYGQCDPDDKDAVASLIDILKNDADESVKLSAALGLAAMGEKATDALPALKSALTSAKNGMDKNTYRSAVTSIAVQKKK